MALNRKNVPPLRASWREHGSDPVFHESQSHVFLAAQRMPAGVPPEEKSSRAHGKLTCKHRHVAVSMSALDDKMGRTV